MNTCTLRGTRTDQTCTVRGGANGGTLQWSTVNDPRGCGEPPAAEPLTIRWHNQDFHHALLGKTNAAITRLPTNLP